jgi:hypothetical protein
MIEPKDETRWARWYWALLLILLVQILLFSYVTWKYSV